MTTDIDSAVVPLRWEGSDAEGHLEMLDQRRLPGDEVWLEFDSAKKVADAIEQMVVRGAPAIGIAAAYGVAIGIRNFAHDPMTSLDAEASRLTEMLAQTRPTAVNLQWALDRCNAVIDDFDGDFDRLVDDLFELARQIHDDDRADNQQIGLNGAGLFDEPVRLLTHCNTGGLATGGYGTALGVVRALQAAGDLEHLWIDETRPYLQGARLTTWECLQDDIDATLITDNMAAHFIGRGDVDAVVTGADRIAANGDVANKIGTYNLAVVCDYHDIPLYVAAPRSTIDLETPTGQDIPIEQRGADEVRHAAGSRLAPEAIDAAHPAFDITPAKLVDAIVTEAGVARAPYQESLAALFETS